jgi:hypothetical protein
MDPYIQHINKSLVFPFFFISTSQPYISSICQPPSKASHIFVSMLLSPSFIDSAIKLNILNTTFVKTSSIPSTIKEVNEKHQIEVIDEYVVEENILNPLNDRLSSDNILVDSPLYYYLQSQVILSLIFHLFKPNMRDSHLSLELQNIQIIPSIPFYVLTSTLSFLIEHNLTHSSSEISTIQSHSNSRTLFCRLLDGLISLFLFSNEKKYFEKGEKNKICPMKSKVLYFHPFQVFLQFKSDLFFRSHSICSFTFEVTPKDILFFSLYETFQNAVINIIDSCVLSSSSTLYSFLLPLLHFVSIVIPPSSYTNYLFGKWLNKKRIKKKNESSTTMESNSMSKLFIKYEFLTFDVVKTSSNDSFFDQNDVHLFALASSLISLFESLLFELPTYHIHDLTLTPLNLCKSLLKRLNNIFCV